MTAGFPRAVGIPIASTDGRRQPYVEASEPLWHDVREIVLCTYDDDAGSTLREDIGATFGKSRRKWVRYPKGCYDLPARCASLAREVSRRLFVEPSGWRT